MPRRVLEGTVTSNKMNKTITVLVERRYIHPVYKKYVKRTDKYAAHDENNFYKEGDKVEIIECAPISRRKRWTVVNPGQPSAAPAAKAVKPAKVAKAPKTPKAEKEPKAEKKEAAKKPAAKKTVKKDKE